MKITDAVGVLNAAKSPGSDRSNLEMFARLCFNIMYLSPQNIMILRLPPTWEDALFTSEKRSNDPTE